MINLTDFSKFRIEVERMFGQVQEVLVMELMSSGKKIDPRDVLVTENGLYSIIEQDGQLFIARVLLHIVGENLNRHNLSHLATGEIMQVSEHADYLRKWHKYHFMYCKALRQWMSGNNSHKYRQSIRFDGRFVSHFIKNNEVILRRNDQKLLPCRYCLGQFNKKYRQWYDTDNFLPEDYFGVVDINDWIQDEGFYPETQNNSEDVYPPGWNKLSKKMKIRKQYTCESCGFVFNDHRLRRFLHCHHKGRDKSDNRISQLQCLCIKCHADQLNHGHMKNYPSYKEFWPFWIQFHSGPTMKG